MNDVLRLAGRYDVRAPRYTSYPTAADFHDGIRGADLAQAIARTNEDARPAPLELYIHLPFCRSLCFYCACNKVITRNTRRARHYLDLVTAEAALLAPRLAPDRNVTQIHLGGGTPTYFSPSELGGLLDALGECFPMAPATRSDWSVEIDPRTVTVEDIAALRELGFSRLSFGVQDLDPLVQETINRRLAFETLEDLMNAARKSHFDSINFDLIYGLPHQTSVRFAHTLSQIVALCPDRIALYGYAHLPNRFRAQQLLESSALPRGADRLALLVDAIETLTRTGYEYIGMDHFARPDDALARSRRAGTLVRNFQGYVPGPDTDLIGLGASAISSLGGAYAQNTRSVPAWETAVLAGRSTVERGYLLDTDDLIRRDVIGSIMCLDEIPFEEFEAHYGVSFADYFRPALERLKPMERDGLLHRGETGLRITPLGRLFLRAIAMVFDARLDNPQKIAAPVYSRVI